MVVVWCLRLCKTHKSENLSDLPVCQNLTRQLSLWMIIFGFPGWLAAVQEHHVSVVGCPILCIKHYRFSFQSKKMSYTWLLFVIKWPWLLHTAQIWLEWTSSDTRMSFTDTINMEHFSTTIYVLATKKKKKKRLRIVALMDFNEPS